MKVKKLLLLFGCAVVLSGCTKSNIVQPEGDITVAVDKPDMEAKGGVELDWQQIGEDMDALYTDQNTYPMCSGEDSVNFDLNTDEKVLNMNLFVKEGTKPEDAVVYATAVVKGLNDEVAVQDFSIEKSSVDSYGGFYKEYTTHVTVIAGTPMSGEDKYLVDYTIPAGDNKPIQPIEEK